MGLMRWMRGGDENSNATAMISAGLAEIDGLFRPSRHKQTEHVEEAKRKRVDVANGAGIDLERGVAMVSVEASAVATAEEGEDIEDLTERSAEKPAIAARPRTVFVPRKQTWWSKMRRERRRRARARAAARSGA
jgi:hypothetical protein